MLGNVPVQASVVGGGALANVDAGDAKGLFGDFERFGSGTGGWIWDEVVAWKEC